MGLESGRGIRPTRWLVRPAGQPANESPPNRRLVRPAGQPANEGSNERAEGGPNRRLARPADQAATESPPNRRLVPPAGQRVNEGSLNPRLVRLADQPANESPNPGLEPGPTDVWSRRRTTDRTLVAEEPRRPDRGPLVAFGAVRVGRGTIVR